MEEGIDRAGPLGVGKVSKQIRWAKKGRLALVKFVSNQFYITFSSACAHTHTHSLFVAYASSACLHEQKIWGEKVKIPNTYLLLSM